MTANSDTITQGRSSRWLLGALVAYGLLAWLLISQGYVDGEYGLFSMLMLLWVAGMLAFVVLPAWLPRILHGDGAMVGRALWCSAGAVALASLVTEPMRLVMFVLPIYGVLHAAVRLERVHVVMIVMVTALAYVAPSLYKGIYMQLDWQFEMFSSLLLAALLGGVLVLSADIHHLRDTLVERNTGLRDAMERMQELALRDDLTGLHNRRYIMEVMQRQKSLADRGQHGFTLCYCDLDHFKVINDKFGHAIGDDALRRFAQCVQSVVRDVDYVARFGGEEFLLLLEDADEETALQVATRLATRAKELTVPNTPDDFHMTVSIGIGTYRVGERVDDVLSRADRALYDAKRLGRDRIVIGRG